MGENMVVAVAKKSNYKLLIIVAIIVIIFLCASSGGGLIYRNNKKHAKILAEEKIMAEQKLQETAAEQLYEEEIKHVQYLHAEAALYALKETQEEIINLINASKPVKKCLDPTSIDWDPTVCPNTAGKMYLDYNMGDYGAGWQGAGYTSSTPPATLGSEEAKRKHLAECLIEANAKNMTGGGCVGLKNSEELAVAKCKTGNTPYNNSCCACSSNGATPCFSSCWSNISGQLNGSPTVEQFNRIDSEIGPKGYRYWTPAKK